MLVLVLGANSDMALASCHQFAQKEKSDFIFAGRNVAELERHAQDFKVRYQVNVTTKAFDACDFPSHPLFFERLGAKPDVVILAFGDEGKQYDDILTKARFCIDVNYLGALSILEPLAKDMEHRKAGSIIVISSVAGDRGRKSNYLYGAAKAALNAYLSALRQRLHPLGVHILTVKPGFVATKMTKGVPLPGLLVSRPEKVGKDIYCAFKKKRLVIYTPRYWQLIMFIIKSVPEFIFAHMKF